MVQPYPCSNCQGVGCRACNGVGFYGRDENYDYYLVKGSDGNVQVSGIKSKGSGGVVSVKIFSFFFRLIFKLIEEPRDFIWASKQRKKLD